MPAPRKSRSGPYIPTRGPFKGQSFPSEAAYRKHAHGYSEDVRRQRAADKYGTPSKLEVRQLRANARELKWPLERVKRLVNTVRSPKEAIAHLERLASRRQQINPKRKDGRTDWDTWHSDFPDDDLSYYHD